MSKYLNSTNFVVGKGSVAFEYDEVVEINVDGLFGAANGGGYVEAIEDPFRLSTARHTILTASGEMIERETRFYVLTGDDTERVRERSLYVATGDTHEYIPSAGQQGVVLKHHTEIIEAEDEDNFIIAGKGWGHGVGISQYGTYDLAKAGATAEQILALYFPSLSLCDYRELR